MPTIHTRVAAAAELLRRAGVSDDEAPTDARLLAQHVLGWNAVRYLADARKADSPDFAARFDAVVARRARREPFAYIVGEREFWGLPFEVSPAVLIPRPETELLVETALALFPDAAPLKIADVCTGSGCLAVALAQRLDTTPVPFPGDHGGFLGGEFGQTGEPEAFAAKLREVLGG